MAFTPIRPVILDPVRVRALRSLARGSRTVRYPTLTDEQLASAGYMVIDRTADGYTLTLTPKGHEKVKD